MGVDPGSPRASVPGKRKRKEPSMGTPKKPQRETSSVGTTELWKPDFSSCELYRQVTAANFARDTDTNLALAGSYVTE